MSEKCPTCGQFTIVTDLDGIKERLKNYDDDHGSGYAWGFWERSSTIAGAEYIIPGIGLVTLVERNYDIDSHIFIVWQIGGDYYKLSGYYSSYSDSQWTGFKKVERKVRSAYVYE